MKRIKRSSVKMLVPPEFQGKRGHPKKRGPGYPAHQPTSKNRNRVRNLSAVGYTNQAIADCLGINILTLKKYYDKELKFATMIMLSAARGALAKAIKKKEPWAVKFTLDRKGRDLGWSQRMEHTGKDGTPLMDLSKLSDEDLNALEQLHAKATPIP